MLPKLIVLSVKLGSVLAVKAWLKHHGESVNDTDSGGSTLLHLAAGKGSRSICSVLLEEFGADSSLLNRDGRTAYEVAAESHPEILDVFPEASEKDSTCGRDDEDLSSRACTALAEASSEQFSVESVQNFSAVEGESVRDMAEENPPCGEISSDSGGGSEEADGGLGKDEGLAEDPRECAWDEELFSGDSGFDLVWEEDISNVLSHAGSSGTAEDEQSVQAQIGGARRTDGEDWDCPVIVIGSVRRREFVEEEDEQYFLLLVTTGRYQGWISPDWLSGFSFFPPAEDPELSAFRQEVLACLETAMDALEVEIVDVSWLNGCLLDHLPDGYVGETRLSSELMEALDWLDERLCDIMDRLFRFRRRRDPGRTWRGRGRPSAGKMLRSGSVQ